MTRFVRLFRYDPVGDPANRLRIDYHPEFGNALLACEDTLLEQVDNPNAKRISSIGSLQLTTAEVRWIAVVAAELADIMERNDVRVQAELDALREKAP